jgi:hypothetical protein
MSPPPGGDSIAEMDEPATAPKDATDPESIIGSSEYRRLLVAVGAIGLFVSLAAWGLLTLVPLIQDGAYQDLPNALGFGEPPWWWSMPIPPSPTVTRARSRRIRPAGYFPVCVGALRREGMTDA